MKSILSQQPVLVTGGGGFIGSNLVRKLISLDCKVYILWKKGTNPWRIKDAMKKVTLEEIDLQDKEGLKKLMETIKPTVIFHLAAHSSYRSQEDVEKMVDISIQGTLNLLIASKNVPYKLFVNTGSSSEYGFKDKPMKESDLLEPISFYASTKAASTLLCQAFTFQYKKPIVTFRPFSVFGPYEQKDRLIPTIILSLIRKKIIDLTSGESRRDFIYVEDIVNAYVNSINYCNKIRGKILNLGTGKEYTNDEIVKILFKIAGSKVPIKKGSFASRMWDTNHWVADISNTKKFLEWETKYTIERGLEETYRWFQNNIHLYE